MKIGQDVAYSAKFLRDIADYSHKSASKRGKIVRYEINDKDFKIVFVDGDFNIAINVKNLRPVKNKVVIELP